MNPQAFTITRTRKLNTNSLQAVLTLESDCLKHDAVRISYPSRPEEADRHFLLWQDQPSGQKVLLSALAISFCDSETLECVAFTHPSYRNKGYFSSLLSCLEEEYEEYDILFPVCGDCADTSAALAAIGAVPDHTELRMEIFLPDIDPTDCPLNTHNTSKIPADPSLPCCLHTNEKSEPLSLHPSCNPQNQELLWTLSAANSRNPRKTSSPASPSAPLGSSRTLRVSEQCVCLHHVEISPKLRGQGLGTRMMRLLLSHLYQQGVTHILLHVSGDNRAAVALYQKTGFRITESLSYYLY